MTAECICDSGFMVDMISNECTDINECLDSAINNCVNSTCVNLPGSFNCSTDVDPFNVCLTGCPANSDCSVSADKLSAICTCSTGYQDSNGDCVDIDECASGNGGCGTQFCVNNDGGFICSNATDPYGVCATGSLGDVACFSHTIAAPAHCSPVQPDRKTYECNCYAGFENTGTHGACVDINECDRGLANCSNGTVCVNNQGAFDCSNATDPHGVCAPGSHKCGPYGTCVVTGAQKDGYTCSCQSGFEIDQTGWTCIDINECAPNGGSNCQSDEICINQLGTFTCTKEDNIDPNGLCASLVCLGASSSCAVSQDKLSAYCACPAGFYYSQNSGCVDVDECQYSMMNLCTNTELCTNTVGSYVCTAHPDPYGKCANAECDHRAVCVPNYSNKRGYDCQCNVGWFGNGNLQSARNAIAYGPNAPKGCKDVDECANNLHDCAIQGKFCMNTEGSYVCSSTPNPGHPCTTGAHACHHLATCQISTTNKVGYTCECNNGFKGNGKKQFSDFTGAEIAAGGPKGCVDVDECKFNLDNCAFGQFCVNSIGSFQCFGAAAADPCASMTCSQGLQCVIDPATGTAGCGDVNECLSAQVCPAGTYCVNSYATYQCIPDSVPSDPCATGAHSCNVYQQCVAMGNLAVCEDRNECTTNAHDCNAFEICYNTDPGWMCFSDPNAVCAGNMCHHDATCVANPALKNGYDCVCNAGYHGNGNRQFRNEISFGPNGPKGCEDIDECKSSVYPCADGEACINHSGGYRCLPVNDNTDVLGVCTFGLHNCDALATCVPNLASKKGYDCECNAGYKGNGNAQMRAEIDGLIVSGAKGCVDVDECSDNLDNCGAWQICVNTVGHYQCIGAMDPYSVCTVSPCGSGFTCNPAQSYQGYTCTDIDECTAHTHTCSADEMCINFAGSFACHNVTIEPVTIIGNPTGGQSGNSGNNGGNQPVQPVQPTANVCASVNCAAGWECVQVGIIGQCIDINECYTNSTACEWGQICQNYPGGYLCIEDPDYVCRHGNHQCNEMATCIPLSEPSQGHKDQYDCLCPAGYHGNGNNKPRDPNARFDKPKGCHDINECMDIPCQSNETCINTAGSYVCYSTPVDPFQYETPCTYNDCDHRADCVLNYQLDKGYECKCQAGYEGNGNAQYDTNNMPRGGKKGCVNVDECALGTHTCGFTQGCIDTEGSFLCIPDPYGVCLPGKHSCNQYSTCRPKEGQLWDHVCECRVGAVDSCLDQCGTSWSFCYRQCLLAKQGSGNVCEDIDECGKNVHNCPTNTTCVNGFPGFSCSVSNDPFGLCNNNGPCPSGKASCHVTSDKTATYCLALAGYVDDGTGNFIDIDECAALTHNCNSTAPGTEICMNTDGSYDCTSHPDPYHLCDGLGAPNNCGAFPCLLTLTKDQYFCDCGSFSSYDAATQSCVDHDDCKNEPNMASWTGNPCTATGFCLNQPNAPAICSNATDPLGVCSSLNCGTAAAGSCVPFNDPSHPLWKTYGECICNAGYANKVASDTSSMCVDIDECKGVNSCSGSEFCINHPGNHSCTLDDDPFQICAEGAHTCGWRGVCEVNPVTRTDYTCGCETGYYDVCENACKLSFDPFCYSSCIDNLYGKQRCANLNECDEYKPTHTCLSSEECVDLDGSFDCLDKCETGDHCDAHATCVADYSKEGFHCKCKAGYHGNGKLQPAEVVGGLFGAGSYKVPKGCMDIDECAFNLHDCVGNEVCVNNDGGFECSSAHDPFGVCAHNAHECHPNAACVPDQEKKRGYRCECEAGYYGNGNFQYVTEIFGRRKRSGNFFSSAILNSELFELTINFRT